MERAVRPLSVDADLAVRIDGRRCAVWTEGDRVVVGTPSLGTARSLLSGADAIPADLRRLLDWLTAADVGVELRVRGATVARMGAGVAPSRLAALAGYDAALSVRGAAVAAWRALL